MSKNQEKETRKQLIQNIEKERNSSVICYITGDRDKFRTKIGEDVIPILSRHLELIGNKDNIDLFLYTRGGDMVAPVRIVKLIRNYCKKFSVLVPYRAHSAGTLIALGADEIVMSKLGELTPVDPTAEAHPFNPRHPVDKNKYLPVSVEDVRSYLLFAKDVLKAREKHLVELYAGLTHHAYPNPMHLQPLALGNVYRAQRMIRILARRLLGSHIDITKKENKEMIEKIIDKITTDICIHNYPIYRDEVKEMGLKAEIPKENIEKLMWDLYKKYASDMELNRPFNPIEILGTESSKKIQYGAAYIESRKALDIFSYDIQINKAAIPGPEGKPPLPGVNVNIAGFSWKKIK